MLESIIFEASPSLGASADLFSRINAYVQHTITLNITWAQPASGL